jgi:hypothetical protein
MNTLTTEMILRAISAARPVKRFFIAVHPNSILGRALSARTGTKRPMKTANRRKHHA